MRPLGPSRPTGLLLSQEQDGGVATPSALGRGKGGSVGGNAGGGGEEYASAVRRHIGIAVPENGGNFPMGVVLPLKDVNAALDSYLRLCTRDER